MKSKAPKKTKTFEKDYNKIMKDFTQAPLVPQIPQWSAPGDYIVKFSLYQETPNSITSTGTSIIF